jgi:hypothetical protein
LRAEQPSLAAISGGALTALLFFAQASHAQNIESRLDVGAVALRYADTLNASAATITPHVLADWGRGIAEASGTYSQFVSGGWSTQGALSASLFTPVARGFLAEVAAFAGGSSHKDGTRTGEVITNGRLHFVRTRGELLFGLGGGQTWGGGASRSLFLGEAGALMTLLEIDATFTISPAIVGDSIKYSDAQLSISWARDRFDLGAVLGTRFGDQLTTLGANATSWASLNAVAWMTPHVALAASGGTYPIDPTQGFPGGRFVSLSIRLATGRSRQAQSPNAPQPQAESRPSEESPSVTTFTAVRSTPDSVTLRVNAPRAQLVEVSGDFTNWVPIRLEPSGGGSWAATLPITPGKYQMNLRIDGGKWIVPPGLLSMLDEFGGTVGLLVVE